MNIRIDINVDFFLILLIPFPHISRILTWYSILM